MDKGQLMRYSQAELELIKLFVSSREDSVLILRNHFLQLGLTSEEQAFLKGLSADFLPVLQKTVLPDLTRDVPMNQQATLYNRVNNLEQINPDVGLLHIVANDIIIDFCTQQFNLLSSDGEPTIILQDLRKPLGIDQDEIRVQNLIAYNQIIPLVEARLNNLTVLANQKPADTEAEAKQRAQANSAK